MSRLIFCSSSRNSNCVLRSARPTRQRLRGRLVVTSVWISNSSVKSRLPRVLKEPLLNNVKPVRIPFAGIYFFPVASAYAALALPWFVFIQLTGSGHVPGLATATGHAHEMLFGFALAVVAGYTLGPQPRRLLLILLILWAAARISFLAAPASIAALFFNSMFVGVLGYQVVPRFRAAKKWRNKAVGPIIAGLCAMVVLYHAVQATENVGLQYGLLFESVLLLSSLMFFMGGRMLAPGVAGHLTKKGLTLEARVQPQIEGAVLVLLGLTLTLNLFGATWSHRLTGILLILAGTLTLVRLLRWQLWHCGERRDLLFLALGYAWLAGGWLLMGMSQLFDFLPLRVSIHAITVGALGTLTLTVMARSRLQRIHVDPNTVPILYIAVALLSVAALLRVASGGWISPTLAYGYSAGCWFVAYCILLVILLRPPPTINPAD